MPELPEVETMRRGVAPATGARIADVERLACPRKPIKISPSMSVLRARLRDRTILDVQRIGKRVVLQIEGAQALVFEPRMTGLLLLVDPPDPLYSRLRVSLVDGNANAILYWDRRGLGNVRLLQADELAAALGPHRLGPDALTMTSASYRERLGSSRRAIKVALLDQQAVAGIGNLYAAEILHAAQIHPATLCTRLTRPQWERLARAAQEVLEEAIRYEGSTLSDGTYRNALNKQGGYQNEHRVYGKAGEVCLRCGGEIVRIVQAQRATFFCPGCQRKRG